MIRALAAALATALLQASPALATPAEHVPDEVVVRFEADATVAERVASREAMGAELDERLLLPRAQVLELPAGTPIDEAVASLERLPGVAYAEPNYVRETMATPDDPGFWEQWGLHNTQQRSGYFAQAVFDADIDALEAWDKTTGSPSVTIGIVDTGIDSDHPDLRPNLVPGYDFVANDADASDEHGHGTAVAGAAAAVGNDGEGIAGVAWGSKLMPLRVADSSGATTSSSLASAFAYAADVGLPIVNGSLGAGRVGSSGRAPSQAEIDAIARASNTLFVFAAGSFGGTGFDLDRPRIEWYPCEYDLPNIICVSTSDQSDQPATYRDNWGATAVDIFAPGLNVLAIDPAGDLGLSSEELGGYSYVEGTSIATPQVAGAAALVRSANPGLDAVGTKAALMAGADQKPQFAGLVASGGRLNANHALGATDEAGVETAITKGPIKPKKDSTPAFEFMSPTRSPATFECKLDKGGFRECKPGKELGELKPGRHTLQVRATDALGVSDTTPAKRSFKIKPGAKDLPSRPPGDGI
jgi:subtilisin family serine protease